MTEITSTPPEIGDLLEGCLPRNFGQYRLVLSVTKYKDGEGFYAGFLIKYLDAKTKRVSTDWWSDMWIRWGVATDG